MHAELAYLFRHALIREAAYGLQPPGERAILHALAIDVIESALAGDEASLDQAAPELARHCRLAQEYRRTANLALLKQYAAKEFSYLLRAAHWCARHYRNTEAVGFLAQVVDHALATPAQRTQALIDGANALLHSGRGAAACEWADRAVAQAESAPDETGARLRGIAFRNCAVTHAQTRGRADAEARMQQALQCFQQAGDEALAALTRSNLAQLQSIAGDPNQGLQAMQDALTDLRAQGHKSGMAATLTNIGNLLRRLGRSAEALAPLREAVAIAREIGDERLEGSLLGNELGALRDLGLTEQAGAVAARSIELATRTGDLRSLSIAYCNRGIFRHQQNDYAPAEQDYRKALQIALDFGERYWEGVARMNLAVLLELTDRSPDAEQEYFEALSIMRQVGDRMSEGIVLCNLGSLLGRFGRYIESDDSFTRGLALLTEVQAREHLGIQHGEYALQLRKQGRTQEAQQHHEQAIELLQQSEGPLRKHQQAWAEK